MDTSICTGPGPPTFTSNGKCTGRCSIESKNDEEISTFISYYFKPHLRTRINRVPRHDDGGEVPSSGNLSIFSNLGRPTPKNAVGGKIFV